MIKFLIGVFVFLFVIPSMIFSIWAYFEQKKEAKNPKRQPRSQNLTHAQMMALLEPDGLKSLQRQSAATRSETKPAAELAPRPEPRRTEQTHQATVKSSPHEVQTITLKRELYY